MRFISQRLPQQLVAELNPSGKKTAIYECDFFALSCAFLEWGHLVSSAAVIYTDNNAVRDTLISCGTSNPTARLLLVATLALECEVQLTPWCSRVPTDSHSSDAPSRLSCKDLLMLVLRRHPSIRKGLGKGCNSCNRSGENNRRSHNPCLQNET